MHLCWDFLHTKSYQKPIGIWNDVQPQCLHGGCDVEGAHSKTGKQCWRESGASHRASGPRKPGQRFALKSIKHDKTTQVVLSHRRRGNPLRLAKCPDTTPLDLQELRQELCRAVYPVLNDRYYTSIHMDVSENRGTPKSSILIGFSIMNHPFWGTTIFGNTHMGIFDNLSIFSTFWGPERTSSSTSKLVNHRGA